MGSFLAQEERWPEAEAALRRSLEVRRETLGGDHPMTARSLVALAEVLEQTRGPEAAVPLLQDAREILLARLGAQHEQTAAVTAKLAKVTSSGTTSR